MYLAKEEKDGGLYYYIRETYSDEGELRSRTLFDLGADPSRFIRYPGGNSYYVHEEGELEIADRGCDVDTFELEELFATIERVGSREHT